MLCNKIEIQIRVYKSKNIKIRTFRANKNGIHIFVVLSDSYIQKKKLQTIVWHRFTQNLEISNNSCQQKVNFKEN